MAYIGFKKLKSRLQAQGKSADQAAGIAASVGRKKYGAKKFARAAAAGKKMKGMKPKPAY